MTLTGAEVWKKFRLKLLAVRVEPGHVVSVVENQQTFRVVQVDPHFLQLALYIEAGPGLGASAVLITVVHYNAVEASAGLDLNASLAIYSLVGHADHPLGFLRHHDFPIVDASGEALSPQDGYLNIETTRRILQRLWMQVSVRNYGAVV